LAAVATGAARDLLLSEWTVVEKSLQRTVIRWLWQVVGK